MCKPWRKRGPRQSGLNDCWGSIDSHRHRDLLTSVKAGTPNHAALSEYQQGGGRSGRTTPPLACVENLAGKLPDCSFVNYVSSCQTEGFVPDISRGYKWVAYLLNMSSLLHQQKDCFDRAEIRLAFLLLIKRTVQVCEADPDELRSKDW